MKAMLARVCMWLSDRLNDAAWAMDPPIPSAFERDHIDTSNPPFGMPPDVEQPRRK